MSIQILEPTITKATDSMGGTIETHPAYGQVEAHRIQGSRTLFGSDFQNHTFIRVTVKTAAMRRTLSRDWNSERESLLSFDLSEAQWASFVSSLNSGHGTPCTLDFIKDVGVIPHPPAPKDKSEQFTDELQETLQDGIAGIKRSLALIDSLSLSKAKAAQLREGLEAALREIECNVGFVAEQFERHTETTVEKAKTEIHGYLNNVLSRAGLEHIAAQEPLTIGAGGSYVTNPGEGSDT